MKKQLIKVVVSVGVFAFLSASGWAVSDPVRRGVVPLSSRRSGLVRSINPIDRSGNLVVTGNVRGGRHFRGVVPYNSTTDFSVPLPSSSLDSFFRRSASVDNLSLYRNNSVPFYSRTRTVTTMSPGLTKIIRPPGANIDRHRPRDSYGMLIPPSVQGLHKVTYKPLYKQRPLSKTSLEMGKLLSIKIANNPLHGEKTEEQYQVELKKLQLKLARLTERTKAIKQDKVTDNRQKLIKQDEHTKSLKELFEKQELQDQSSQEDVQPDIYEQMRQRYLDAEKFTDQLEAKRKAEEIKKAKKEGKPARKRRLEGESLEDREFEEDLKEESSIRYKSSKIDLATKAKAVMGPHKTFASFAKDNFNLSMKQAERYLQEGKYYKAADTYTMASLYKSGDPLAYAGKSHALFAAGEYMSSALFLSRALEIFPEYAKVKIDLVTMVGDRDTLEDRILDIDLWLEKSGAPEMNFLLGYIYFHIDRLEKAKEAIDAAYEEMSDIFAVAVLKEAIDEAAQ